MEFERLSLFWNVKNGGGGGGMGRYCKNPRCPFSFSFLLLSKFDELDDKVR